MVPIELETNKIITNINPESDIKFRIGSSRYIFDLLRRNIYTDPIGSCVREICANAVDSMRRKGNSHLPISITLTDNYFVVKDEGDGISPEVMSEIYSVYGASTKRGDNLEQGFFGIGAKSSWAIADSYTIETVWDGIKYAYLAYMDDDGAGSLKLISSTKSDEVGTTVKTPIPHSDHYKFKEAIYKYTLLYSVIPLYRGELAPILPEVILSGTGWRQYKEGSLDRVGRIQVLCDGVPYRYYCTGLPNNVILIFNVGDLEVTAAREELRVCDHNTSKIIEAIATYKDERYQAVYDKIKSEPDYENVIKFLMDNNDKAQREFEWRGRKFNYPLDENILVFGNSWKKYTPTTTRLFDRKVNHLFLTGPSYDAITQSHKRKLGQFFNGSPGKVYIVPPDFIFPIKCDVDDIKVVYPKGSGGGKPKYIQVRYRDKKTKTRVEFSPRQVYTLDKLEDALGLNYLSFVVEMDEANLKKVKKFAPDWITLDDYVDSFGVREDLAARGVLVINRDFIYNWQFLKDHVSPEIKELLTYVDSTNVPLDNVCRFACINSEVAYNDVVQAKLFERYPMFSVLRTNWLNDEVREKCVDYVTLIEKQLRSI